MAASSTCSITVSASMIAKRHKPAPEAYAEVTRALRASPSEMCMVACHTWDTIGAQAAGWEAGLIKRVNNDVLDTAAQPQYVGKDLNVVADQIIARNDPGTNDGAGSALKLR
jgi:2-haloacid dehalogenase